MRLWTVRSKIAKKVAIGNLEQGFPDSLYLWCAMCLL